jgi:hypothetical protein
MDAGAGHCRKESVEMRPAMYDNLVVGQQIFVRGRKVPHVLPLFSISFFFVLVLMFFFPLCTE